MNTFEKHRALVKFGLAQIPDAGLKRLAAWEGPMCLNGYVVDEVTKDL